MALHDPLLAADKLAHFSAHGGVKRAGLFTAGEAAEIARWSDELVALAEEPGRHHRRSYDDQRAKRRASP